MKQTSYGVTQPKASPYLNLLGVWALSFGCSVGWGAFVMPGSTFLPYAGPVGSCLGLVLGALVMVVFAINFHYLMNRYPDKGGVYSYAKICLGYDHGFLSAWFLILTYVAIIWANATALPLIARSLFGGLFQFGYDYVIAGFHVYLGEVLLAILALTFGAVVCLHRELSQKVQTVAALALFFGVVLCFGAAMLGHKGSFESMAPAFSPDHSPLGGSFTVFALAPWAYVGFESISHSSEETKFSLKHSFMIMLVALLTSGIAYGGLAVLAASSLPEGVTAWPEYVKNLGEYGGIMGIPTFFGATRALGGFGTLALGLAALGAILTGLVGNYIALSRLLCAVSDDQLLPAWIGEREEGSYVSKHAIFLILGVSAVLPFLGRTAISWIVDVTTVGATIAYGFGAVSAWKTAKDEKNFWMEVAGIGGLILAMLFFIEFLVPNITSVKTLATESYLIFAAWGILGFLIFRWVLARDTKRRIGRSIVAWVVLLGLILFTSSVWMHQTTSASIERAVAEVGDYYREELEKTGMDMVSEDTQTAYEYVHSSFQRANDSLSFSNVIQIVLIAAALLVLLDIYSQMQKREKRVEVEKALAEESSKAKTSFLSNMSHEIRTPMNAIIGLDNIALRDPNLTPRTREHLEKIGASAKHLLGLINDILDMSRIESGRMALKNEEFSFREFLDQVSVIINGQCRDKGLQYSCHIIGRVYDYFYGDDLKLKQILINILGNSVKFTDPPGEVSLSVQQLDKDGDICRLRFTIKDTGIGMDESFIPKLFEAFSQEDATTTNAYGGSGLGMSITKNYVEMMGGTIEVQSMKGVGSTFFVTVSLQASDRKAALEEKALTLPEGLRALVVDDEEIACEHIRLVLESLGVPSDTTTSSKDALEMLRSAHERGETYPLLLTDYRMPDLTGMDLVKAVRSFSGNETAIIILTGYNLESFEDEAFKERVDGILSKPLFSDSLLREIHSILVRRKGYVPKLEEEIEEEEDHSLAGRRVLMAEDVEQNSEILMDLLELEDMEAEHAQNGQIAVDMFRESEEGYYDAILMDVRMPVMDGLTATRQIRALDRPDAKTIPIIAMTANVFDEDVEQSLNAGMNAHLSKPIEPEKLYDTMRRLIIKEE